jgi:hypothetical protein
MSGTTKCFRCNKVTPDEEILFGDAEHPPICRECDELEREEHSMATALHQLIASWRQVVDQLAVGAGSSHMVRVRQQAIRACADELEILLDSYKTLPV